MLPKQHRLQKSKDIINVLKQGTSTGNAIFHVSVIHTTHVVSRFAFVVSNQISKRATQRNKVKRRAREAVRSLLPRIRPGYDVVIRAKPYIVNKDNKTVQEFDAIKRALDDCFSLLNLY